jgi:hypothetical protein
MKKTIFLSGVASRGLMILFFFTLFLVLGTNTINAQYVGEEAAMVILKQEAVDLADKSILKNASQQEINRLPVKQRAVKHVLLQLLDGETVANAVENVVGPNQNVDTAVHASTGFTRGFYVSTKSNQPWLEAYINDLLGS